MYSNYGIMFIKEYSLVLLHNCNVISSVVVFFLVTNLHTIMYLYMQKYRDSFVWSVCRHLGMIEEFTIKNMPDAHRDYFLIAAMVAYIHTCVHTLRHSCVHATCHFYCSTHSHSLHHPSNCSLHCWPVLHSYLHSHCRWGRDHVPHHHHHMDPPQWKLDIRDW